VAEVSVRRRQQPIEEPPTTEFELHIADEEPEHDHGPLTEEPARPPTVWLRRAPMAPRRERASKGWRRHLRRSKAQTRGGR
jgi:hypothetical protein